MDDSLFPSVRWAQDKTNIFIKVELRNVENHDIKVSTKNIRFQAVGEGAKGRNQYHFNLNLYGSVKKDSYSCKKEESCFSIWIKKENYPENGVECKPFWPRLTEKNEKFHWLNVDFDKWRDSDDSDSDTTKKRNIFKDFDMGAYEKQQADEIAKQIMGGKRDIEIGLNFSLTRPYLITYNCAMFLGFLLILIDLIVGYYRENTDYFPKVWSHVSGKMFCCQIAQFLEIGHALLGYVKGSPLASTLQTFGRGFVLLVVLNGEPRMHDKPFVFYLFLVWSMVEVIRVPAYSAVFFGDVLRERFHQKIPYYILEFW